MNLRPYKLKLLSLTTHLICFSLTPVQFNCILNKGEENLNPNSPLDIVYCFLFISFYCGILGFLYFHRTCCIYQVLLHQWLLVSSLNVTIALNVSVKTPVWLFMMFFSQIFVHSLKTADQNSDQWFVLQCIKKAGVSTNVCHMS